MKTSKPQDASVWKKRVEGLEASGQSCSDCARRIGVNTNTLAGWRGKLRRRGPPAPAEKVRKTAHRERPDRSIVNA